MQLLNLVSFIYNYISHIALRSIKHDGNSSLCFLLKIIIILSKFNAVTDSLYHKTSVALQGK